MLTIKIWLPQALEGFGKKVKQIGLVLEYAQCVYIKIVWLVFIIFGVRLFTLLPPQCYPLIFISKRFSKAFFVSGFVVDICSISC